MKLNKKGVNITNPYTIILVIIVIAMFSIQTLDFGADLAQNPNNNLDQQSVSYIYNKTGFSDIVYKNQSSDTNTLFFSSELNTSGNLKDFALEFQFYREQSSSIRSILQSIWNIPSWAVSGLGLDISDWSLMMNLWNTIIWVIVFIAVYKIIRGLIN